MEAAFDAAEADAAAKDFDTPPRPKRGRNDADFMEPSPKPKVKKRGRR